jgi:GT2 family glycosyltransferase
LAISRYEKLKKENDKFIIAYAPADYEILSDGSIDTSTGNVTSIFANNYSSLVPGFTFPFYERLEIDKTVESFWATCCYLLAPKSWVKEVGISKHESFNTEEFSLSLRTFAKGWKIFSIGTRDVFHHQSHRQQNGTVTRQTLRPWADDRKESYWNHVQKSTDRLSMLMSGKLDVDIEKAQQFFNHIGLSSKYLSFIPNYSSHIVIENRGFGMPPRRD